MCTTVVASFVSIFTAEKRTDVKHCEDLPMTNSALIYVTIRYRYDTIRDAILTCARKPTLVSLIYPTEPTTKKCKIEKLKSKYGYAQK